MTIAEILSAMPARPAPPDDPPYEAQWGEDEEPDDDYDCPIHGRQKGADCPRC
jgi:hypothetical protein